MTLTQAPARLRLTALAVLLLAVTFLQACAGRQVWATDAEIQAARHVHGGAAELTLVTIMNYTSGRGDHTALFINADERVLFDPAGSWRLDEVPERNDVHFGMSANKGASFYMTHTRATHYTVVQRLRVTPEVAAQAKALALAAGPVPPARCALSTSGILRQLPGFESIRSGWYPHNLMADFDRLPGVQRYELHHDAPDILQKVYQVQRPL